MTDSALIPATDLLKLYRNKRLSPVEVARDVCSRIDKHNPRLNAYCLLDEDKFIAAARESEKRWHKREPLGLLDGVPVSIKDIILTKGWPTLRGSLLVDKQQAWDENAPSTARLLEHGALLVGKTTTPEFGWKAVTDSPLTGITRNPWNPEMTAGGSSGGAVAAVAAGMCALALGTDGGGSIRIPAGFSGLFGIKPSFGRVPAAPLSPFGTLAHIGPITRTVADAALMLTVIAEPDSRDWYALPAETKDYRIGLDGGVKYLRVAYSPDLGYAAVDPEITQIVERAIDVFVELGARVELVAPGFDNPRDVFLKHWSAGAANLARNVDAEQRAKLDPGLAQLIEVGESWGLLDYLHTVDQRVALGQHMNRFHEHFDLLVTPTLPITAFPAGDQLSDANSQEFWFDWTPFSYPFNLTQQPAASIPCGFTSAGLPVGLQIVGPRYGDDLVLRASHAFEKLRAIELPSLAD
ncbi:MAG: amidase [Gammaproteobacteria bacterium]|nr:amidase [Gammaproteobacteria bacterium]